MRTLLWTITLLIIGFAALANASVIDAPHNQTNNIICSNCHSYTLWWQQASSSQAQSPEKTAVVNAVCMHCHDAGGSAPMAQTHAASVMGSDYHEGNWGVGCTVCHNPHLQEQLSWLGAAEGPLLVTGTITGVIANSPQENQSTITYADASTNPDWPAVGDTSEALAWDRKNSSGRGLIFVHDASRADNTFTIVSANSNQIVIKGVLNPNSANPAYPGNLASCNTFGLIYGQLIRSQITTPFSGTKDVKFFTPLGGFVNQEEPASGVCQVCHTETAHFRNTGETNIDSTGLDHSQQTGADCVDCHAHGEGFAHGVGGTSAVGCGLVTECHGTQGSHPPHLNPEGMVQGTCTLCHDTNNFPTFADGQTTIAATTVCDPCHNDGKGSPVDTPEWGASSPPPCTACHAAVPATGSHGKHLANSWISCGNCHNATEQSSTPPAQHLDHNIDVYHTTPGDLGYPADKEINSPVATCSVPACHGAGTPLWGGTVGCESCHLSASDFGDYTFGNFVIAQIGSNEWTSSGHGKATGNYDLSANPAANLGEAAGSASPCLYCHDAAVSHGTTSNPFRLANTNAMGDGANDTCLVCHATAGSGYDPDGGGTMALKSATIKVDKYHYGSAHGASNNGGSLCWDCHDPHGDRSNGNGNIYMIHSAVVKAKADAYGTPAAIASPIFTANATGSDYARSEAPYTGICQVCHDATTYYRSTTGANGHFTERCTNCHLHGSGTVDQYAFNHGGGSGDAAVCQQCHGHDAGYDGLTGGKGSYATHSSHTENDADDARGPFIGCDGCHDTASMPDFKDGVSYLAYKGGAATTVCNTCHSDQGSYDGVNDAVIGARNNWQSGVYEADGSLQAGKEKWCASCHDEVPSVIGGVSAPNVIGDEDGASNYGTDWGFYKTGHGVPASETMPASGGVTNGPDRGCVACHDTALAHVDGEARTYDCASGTGGACTAQYQSGYRLRSVSGSAPMEMPPTGVNVASFRLCFDCHTNTDAWLTNNRAGTNFYQEGSSRNDHYYHLTAPAKSAENDWDHAFEGWLSCIVCHNVHGSKNPAMVRSGELTGFPSLTVRYGNATSTHTPGQQEPVPNDITLVESTKLTMLGNLATSYCQHCHGTGTGIATVTRTPANIPTLPPLLSWVGIPGYETDGVNPDSASSGATFTFRISYSDINRDAATAVQLWIDLDNNGDYNGPGEIIDMQHVDPDPDYLQGADFMTTVVIDKSTPAGNTVSYQFHAQAGGDVATGSPTNAAALTVANATPLLDWTGETNFVSDGVDPDNGPKDSSYAFRVKYTDDDGDACPASGSANIQVWIDLNSNLAYESDEKFNLNEVEAADTDCTTIGGGKLYLLDKELPNSSGITQQYHYRFQAFDGTGAATGSPVNGSTVSVEATSNTPPILAWNSGTCRPQGAMPPTSATSSTIAFSVIYVDEDNEYPASDTADIQVWVDLDNSGSYGEDEKFNLSEESPADSDCTTAGGGKIYGTIITPTTVADGISYEFHANDGVANALGAPATAGGSVNVRNADYVVRQDGSEDYTTITAAISAVGIANNKTILVYDGTYNESLTITQDPLILISACGADETVITHGNNPVVNFNLSVGSIMDGFTVTGGSGVGIKATGNNFNGITSTPTINNCLVHDNVGRGVQSYRATVTITGSEIYNNQGGGVSFYQGSLSDSVVRNNTVTGNGGGVTTDAGDKGGFTLSQVTIKDNTATGKGGGLYCQNSNSSYQTSFDKVVLTGNTSSANSGGGGYFTYCTPTFTNSVVADNSATSGGGISLGIWSSAWFINSTIANNNATAGNGGGYASADGPINLANTIAWGNRASGTGHIGAFTSTGVKEVYLYDSVIENNGDGDITDDEYFSTTATVHVHDGLGNFDADPNFIDATNADPALRNYHVQAPSIAIDNAQDHSGKGIPTEDLDGNSRPQGAAADIGAYEVQ